MILAVALLAAAGRADADSSAVYYRLFLTDGTSVASYGEYARVADTVVFSMALGGTEAAPVLQLASLPASRIDWPATEQYADAARAAHYAATRGEPDYAALSDAVAAALNGIAQTEDAARRLQIADGARRRLAEWSRGSYGYRSRDVAQLSSMLDEVAAEIRAAAGWDSGFDLQLVATVSPPSVPLLAAPSAQEAAQQAYTVASLTGDPSERKALLSAVARSLAGSREPWAATLAARARREMDLEEGIDYQYIRLTHAAVTRASARAGEGDVRGVQGVIADVLARDDRLGRRRPSEVSALLATLDARLETARRLRLARDRWLLRVAEYRTYSRQIAEGVQILHGLEQAVDDIRELAGPSRLVLLRAQLGTQEAALTFSRVTPPEDLRPVHALFASAVQLAADACRRRLDAVATGSEEIAWSASSAAAGSLMLLERAQKDLSRWLKPPSLP
ncbi:MAG TPA: hypothetical protein VK886_13400 [Vicinamibacterales bacterium]|nr:hypothetical protein [Vicinamibacterales bacterium]